MGDKGGDNRSEVTDFILVGIRVRPELHSLLFLLFLVIYGMVLLGNLSMIGIIVTDPRLNTPMYFFLGNLSVIDLSYCTVIVPKAMVNILSQKKTISFAGCVTQLFLYALFMVTEAFVLAAMAYDRFIAICNPLLYSVSMSRRICIQLVAGSYLCGWVSSILQISATFSMSFCASRVIDHFYCDSNPIEKISCSNIFINKMVSFSLAVVIILPTIIVIVVSYMYIVSTVLKIPSAEGRKKAFSTCSSHLGVVSLLYGTVSFVYLTPPNNPELRKVASVCYILFTPMLNPLIYSLRNKDVKDAMRKVLWKKKRLFVKLESVLKVHLFISCASHQVSSMGDRGTSNHSETMDFILVGFGVHPELHIFIFLIFLLTYGMIILGNVGMMAIIVTDPRLNTPMYFFLGNLSFIDLFYSSVIAPKAMTNFWSESKSISFAGCVAQLFLFTLFIVTEGFLLAAMAYDRFVAICNPLLYSVQMSTRLCAQLVAGSYFCGCISSVLQSSITFTLSFCASRAVDHFYCDTRPLQRLSCSDISIHKIVSFSLSSIIILPTVIVIIVSYMYIVSTVLKIHSMEGRKKAFSTCSSHLGVVSVLYGTVFFMYLTPDRFPELSKVASLCYSLVTPMLNPLIYSLRNKDVKEALKKLLEKKHTILY
ncbi:LOW QUALITY PROTEIN: olfactory receptor 9K2-like [Erethizon dorsatum]